MIRSILGVSLLGVMALGSAMLISNEYSSLIASGPHASMWGAQKVTHQTCVSDPLAVDGKVRGLYGVDVPALASAERQTFDGAGYQVSYAMQATPEAVASFYSQRLTEHCWRQAQDGGLVFKDYTGNAVRITLAYNNLNKKTAVNYERGGIVLGESTVSAAQFDSSSFQSAPPPPGDMGGVPPPTGDFGGQQGGFTPPLSGGFNQPPSGQGFPPSGFVPSNVNAPNQFPGARGQFPDGPQYNNQNGSQQGPNDFAGGQTCRVNGVEMPGPCSQYEEKSGRESGGFNGQGFEQNNQGYGLGNQAGYGQKGMQEFSEQNMEQQERQMDDQRFKMMKQGAKRFASEVKKMKARIKQLKNKMKGCALPAEIDNALSASDGLVAKIEAAQSADELEAVLSDIEDATGVLQESGQEIPDYMRACEMKKRIGKDVAKLEKRAKLVITKAKKDSSLTELVQALEGDIASVKTLVKEGEALASTDVSEAGAKFEEAYDKFQDIGDGMEALDIASNLQKNIAKLTKKVKPYETAIARREKKKEDMSEAKVGLEEFKSLLSELQAAIKNKEGKDMLIDLMQSLYEAKQQLDKLLGGQVDGQILVPQFKVQEKGFEFKAPEGFERQMMPQEMGTFGGFGGGEGGFGPSMPPPINNSGPQGGAFQGQGQPIPVPSQ